ncbi:hypothetical protein ACIA98_13150 [Streptomyces sp. NPDC051366]|uniref:hypothetical protein n=1 Tax=Streptomyces sp. NPDC051366 TaxID=3365652 RepID=UPI00378BFA21
MPVLVAALGALLTLGGCGEPDDGTRDLDVVTPSDRSGGQRQAGVPRELVGRWSGGSSDQFRSSVYSFYADGTYRTDINRIGSVTGRFVVGGNRLTTYTDAGVPMTYEWYIGQDGYLHLNGETYVPFP